METIEIVLDRNQIEAIINGERVKYEIDGVNITVRESYIFPLTAPLIERPIKAVDTNHNAVVNKQYFNHLQNRVLSDSIQ